MFLHLFALANTIILHYAFSSLKKLLARFVSLLLFWQKKYEMPLYAYHFSVVLHSWDLSFRATSDKHVLASYTTTRNLDRIVSAHMYVIEHWVRAKVVRFSIAGLEFSLLYLPHTFDSFHALPHQKYQLSSFFTEQPLHQNFHFHRKPRYRTKTRKPRMDIGKHRYSVLDNGGHLVREKHRFYRTYQISVGFDRRTDILREVCTRKRSDLSEEPY